MKKYLIVLGIAALGLVSVAGAQTFTFSNNLAVGSNGNDVVQLQMWLMSNGYDIPSISSGTATRGYFGSQTKMAVIRYQAENGIPNTGFVGPLTRAKLNGKGISTDGRSPVINSIEAPTVLAVGQTGTWTVRATDPQNGSLNYSVDWGDVTTYMPLDCLAGYVCEPNAGATVAEVKQSSTFTHSYSKAGTYTVKIVVRDNEGLVARTSSTVQVGSTMTGALMITSPNGGESWQKNTAKDITWTAPQYFRPTFADIRLLPYQPPCTSNVCPLYAPLVPYTIADNVPINQNSYNWIVGQVKEHYNTVSLPYCAETANGICLSPSFFPDGKYQVQICEVNTGNCDASNAPFTISSGIVTPTVTVNSPNGGEVWAANSVHRVSWTLNSPSSANAKVDMYLGKMVSPPCIAIYPTPASCAPTFQQYYVLDKNIANDFIYDWIVATDISNNPIASGDYIVRVCTAGSLTHCDTSNSSFTITGTASQVFTCPDGYVCMPR